MSLAGHLVGGYRKAHHNPIAILNGDTTRTVLELTAKPGDTVRLSADQTHDPDAYHSGDGRSGADVWTRERPHACHT